MQTSILYDINKTSPEKILINQGGTSSGKTYSIVQVLFTLGMEDPGCVITVVGQDVPNLKKGAYRDAKTEYHRSKELVSWYGRPNETDRTFSCKNGSIMEFTSFKDEQDAKSGKRDYLFINEADGIQYQVYRQLALRTRKKIFIDYNPSTRFWVHEQLIGKPGTKLIISDHRHNPFLSEEEHEKIESIDDKEFWKVYVRGMTGELKGLIYPGWGICEEMPKDYKYRWFGLDFGFTNDPTAFVEVRLSGGVLYIDEIIYQKGMLNSDIYRTAKASGVTGAHEIIADAAEPKSIAELRAYGLNVVPAQKGPDSIKLGIDTLKKYKVYVTRRSANIRDERGKYRWKTGNDGEPTNTPIELFNHAMDAIRYVGLNKLVKKAERGKTTYTY